MPTILDDWTREDLFCHAARTDMVDIGTTRCAMPTASTRARTSLRMELDMEVAASSFGTGSAALLANVLRAHQVYTGQDCAGQRAQAGGRGQAAQADH